MSRTILLADDSVTIQKVVELTFLDREYVVTSVTNGDEAIAALEGSLPDLVIADVHMPGPSGYDVCREAKRRSPELPVLLLVGTFEPFNEQDASACGSNGFLKKPFDSQELLRRVEELLEGAAVPVAGSVAAAAAPRGVAAPAADPSPISPEAPSAAAPASPVAPGVAPPATEQRTVENPVASSLSDEQLERIAHRVVELIGEKVVREVAWEVIPDLAELVIKDRLRELEEQVEKL